MLLTQPNKFTATHRTIKNDNLFLVDTNYGEIPANNDSGLGLYELDTRILSQFEIFMNGTKPVCLLSSTESGYMSSLVYTNGQMETQTQEGFSAIVPEETIELKRDSILEGALLERYTVTNYSMEPVTIQVAFHYDADFRDIFEIRHLVPFKERILSPPRFEENMLVYEYPAKDFVRLTRVQFVDFVPRFEKPFVPIFHVFLHPLESTTFHITVDSSMRPNERKQEVKAFHTSLQRITAENYRWKQEVTEITSDNADFNEMMERAHKDLRMLMTPSNDGLPFVAAGIPWYVCLFGRDSIITARQSLSFNSNLAKATLQILAKYQGQTVNDWRDEEPGKILHELRTGELASLGEIPHTPYYGSVDATPLWIVLLHDYFLWTWDCETLKMLWPNALAALDWIDRNLAKNEFGFLTYQTHCPIGIIHQGWKDSNNSAMYENGLQAEPPIALVEVQGYVYMAKRCLAFLADILGDRDLKQRLRHEYTAFKHRFNQAFWMQELYFYALGLDSQGRQLRVISSNPGHGLETGIYTAERAKHVATRLVSPDLFSGWGIRTLSGEMLAYNPMSYHNGSVWPHDNAMVAKGMADIGRTDLAEKIFSGLYEAARLMQYKRLPELFCGFSRDLARSDPPVRYPVACSPQAWAAGAVYSFICSMLNMIPDLQHNALRIKQPKLPAWLNSLRIKNLHIGQALLDLEFHRTDHAVVMDVRSRHGKIDIFLKI